MEKSDQNKIPLFEPYVDICLGAVAQWDNSQDSMQPLKLEQIIKSSKIKSVRVSFLSDSTQGPNWNGYPINYGQKIFEQLSTNLGINIILSVGGFSGKLIGQDDVDEKNIYNKYSKVLQTFPYVKKLDLDIENSLQQNKQQLLKIFKALRQLQQEKNIEISLTLPTFPFGMTHGKQVVQIAFDSQIKFSVNLMTMNYIDPSIQETLSYPQKNQGQLAIQSIQSLHQFLYTLFRDHSSEQIYQIIQVTPMIGLNDQRDLKFLLKDVDILVDFCMQMGVGCICMWSLGRDKKGNGEMWGCSGEGMQERDWQYTERFIKRLNQEDIFEQQKQMEDYEQLDHSDNFKNSKCSEYYQKQQISQIHQEKQDPKNSNFEKKYQEYFKNPCARCLKIGHQIHQCNESISQNGQSLSFEDICQRCHRNWHSQQICNAIYDLNGQQIDD